MDRIDRKILEILAKEARLSMSQLAARVGLSKSPCQVRVKRLEEAGVIRGYAAMIDPESLGQMHVAFVEVKLVDTREAALKAFNEAVRAVPQIEECYMIAGAFDYLLKIRSRDMSEYRRILGEVISALPHVGNSSTHVSMEAVKEPHLNAIRMGKA